MKSFDMAHINLLKKKKRNQIYNIYGGASKPACLVVSNVHNIYTYIIISDYLEYLKNNVSPNMYT